MTKLQRIFNLMERHGNNPRKLAETLALVLDLWYATIALACVFFLMWICAEVMLGGVGL